MKTMQMKAVLATGYGSAEVLQLSRVSRPEPQPDEVLVKVHASSATRADSMMLSGKPYIGRLFNGLKKPKNPIPGTGFAGVVEAIGADVSTFQQGDRVFGETTLNFSTNAEYVAVAEKGVVLPMPDNMRYEEAASFCDGPLTSFNFLKAIAQVQPGEKVLINGAAGSLGSAAVQLAKYLGAEVTGVCSTGNLGLAKSLGADHVIDYRKQDFTQSDEKYDFIYDTVGKSSFSQSQKVLRPYGMYLSPVLKFPLLLEMIRSALFGRKKAKFAATGLKSVDELRTMLAELVHVYQEGKLKVVIDRQFPLEKLADAHRYIELGHKKGNVVIVTA